MHGNVSFESGSLELNIAIRGLSHGEFAREADIDSATLARALRGDRLRSKSWGKILKALARIPAIEGADELVRAS